jgi:3alpha(or 20beta)-hydroxysteroid dehydrogenase
MTRTGSGMVEGKVAIITGAARGHGAAEARLLAAEGANVVVADVLDDLGAQVAAEIGDRARFRHLDVSRAEEWSAAIADTEAAFGPVNVLVNNAAILRRMPIEEMEVETYMAVITVNQLGCWLGMRSILPSMRAAGGGSIVNISSTAGLQGNRGLSAYAASKWAVRGMTKVAALEFGEYGIRVNSVHPGAITGAMATFPPDAPDGPWLRQPVARVGQPEEVAELVVFLASDRSSYSSGAEFLCDGGAMAGRP